MVRWYQVHLHLGWYYFSNPTDTTFCIIFLLPREKQTTLIIHPPTVKQLVTSVFNFSWMYFNSKMNINFNSNIYINFNSKININFDVPLFPLFEAPWWEQCYRVYNTDIWFERPVQSVGPVDYQINDLVACIHDDHLDLMVSACCDASEDGEDQL